MSQKDNELDHVVMIASALIAQGRPHFTQENLVRLASEALRVRNGLKAALADRKAPLPGIDSRANATVQRA